MIGRNNYRTVLESLRSRLDEGMYVRDSLLPPEEVLAQEYGVSRPTVAKAFATLISEGLIARRRGVGTIVVGQAKERKPYRFGMLLPGAGESEIFSEINSEIMSLSAEQGFDCEWSGATANNAETRHFLAVANCERYLEKDIDGIFFAPLEKVKDADMLNEKICQMVSRAGVPMVLIDRDTFPILRRSGFDVVGLDNYVAGVVMARHMIDAGCRNIYFFESPYSAPSVGERLMAVKHTVEEAGLDFFPDSHLCGNPNDRNVVAQIPIIKGQTGIICANDSTAVILMSVLEECGYGCGVDYLISGFDNMKYSLYLKTPLTTFSQPCKEIARVSVEMMMRRMEKMKSSMSGDGSSESQKEILPLRVLLNGSIVVRESTKWKR